MKWMAWKRIAELFRGSNYNNNQWQEQFWCKILWYLQCKVEIHITAIAEIHNGFSRTILYKKLNKTLQNSNCLEWFDHANTEVSTFHQTDSIDQTIFSTISHSSCHRAAYSADLMLFCWLRYSTSLYSHLLIPIHDSGNTSLSSSFFLGNNASDPASPCNHDTIPFTSKS